MHCGNQNKMDDTKTYDILAEEVKWSSERVKNPNKNDVLPVWIDYLD